jgi:Response regulator containing CheY-like receiver, AAA-type ATPase, and DNA-binding domains
MQGNNKGTATPVATAPSFVPTLSTSGKCLLHSSTLLEALTQAKQEREIKGTANAYAVLLEQFHKAILPAFFCETQGNLSEVARLLGIHRQTIRLYCDQAHLNLTSTAGKVGAA